MPTGKRHYRLTFADALSAHATALEMGGCPGILNQHMIESALARPYSGYYRRIAQKAAAFVESMATNHGFVDGNKRTTLLLTVTLLERSGYDLASPEPNGDIEVELEELIVAVAERHLTVEQVTDWFRARIRSID